MYVNAVLSNLNPICMHIFQPYTPRHICWDTSRLPCFSQFWSARWQRNIGRGRGAKEQRRQFSGEVSQLVMSGSVAQQSRRFTRLTFKLGPSFFLIEHLSHLFKFEFFSSPTSEAQG